MSRIEFGLTVGMTSSQIEQELFGRVQGESRAEMMEFFSRPPMVSVPGQELWETYEIVAASDEYGLLMKRNYSLDTFKNRQLSNSYFLAGIGDEGKYFVHPLTSEENDFPPQPPLIKPPSYSAYFEELLEWVNRKDMGFSTRVQGDLIMQFAPIGGTLVAGMAGVPIGASAGYAIVSTSNSRWTIRGSSVTTVVANPVDARAPDSININPATMNNVWSSGRPDNFVGPLSTKSLALGNHMLSTDGHIYIGRFLGIDVAAVEGSTAVFQHPQHEFKEVHIPSGHLAIMTGQRGRTISIDASQGSRGFD